MDAARAEARQAGMDRMQMQVAMTQAQQEAKALLVDNARLSSAVGREEKTVRELQASQQQLKEMVETLETRLSKVSVSGPFCCDVCWCCCIVDCNAVHKSRFVGMQSSIAAENRRSAGATQHQHMLSTHSLATRHEFLLPGHMSWLICNQPSGVSSVKQTCMLHHVLQVVLERDRAEAHNSRNAHALVDSTQQNAALEAKLQVSTCLPRPHSDWLLHQALANTVMLGCLCLSNC